MSSSYPSSLDIWGEVANGVDDVDATHINDLRDAVEKIEVKLGRTSECCTTQGIDDADGDTKVTVENASDEDTIRFWIGVSGSAEEQMNLTNGKLAPTTDNDLDIGDSSHRIKEGHFVTAYGCFHPRTDDPSSYDKTSFTQEAWTDWDLSSIVPAGAVAVLLRVHIDDASSAHYVKFRKNGNSNTVDVATVRTAGTAWHDEDVIVACDTNRVIEYFLESGTDTCNVVVRGWWF